MSGAVCLHVAFVWWLLCATCGVDSQPTIADNGRCSKSGGDEDGLKTSDDYQILQKALHDERQRVKSLEIMLDADKKKSSEGPRNLSVALLKRLSPASFDSGRGVAIGRNEIYVMGEFSKTIRVFRDDAGFQQLRDISISGVNQPYDLIYSNKTDWLYIADYRDKCIWKLEPTNEIMVNLTIWLDNITPQCTMSLTPDGNILLAQQRSSHRLEIYDPTSAELIFSLRLPTTLLVNPQHSVQTPWETFIVSHYKKENNREQSFLTQITSGGKIVNHFNSRIDDDELSWMPFLCLDLTRELLLVADVWMQRILVFDARTLTLTQILASSGRGFMDRPFRLLIDEGRRRLFSQNWATRKIDNAWKDGRLDVYQLS